MKKIHPTPSDCPCLGVATEFVDTLQRICSTSALFALFEFWSAERQEKLFKFLKDKDEKLYANLDVNRRSISVRVTGMF